MIAVTLFAMGLGLTVEALGEVFRRPRNLVWGLVLNFAVVPLMMLALAEVSGVAGPPVIALLLLATSPGGGTGTLFVAMARGDIALAVALLFLLTVLSTLLTPLLVVWVTGDAGAETVGAGAMLRVIVLVQLLPLVAGMGLLRVRSRLAARLEPLATRCAILLLAVVTLAYLVTRGELLLAIAPEVHALSVALLASSFGVCWLVWGLSPPQRVALSLTTMVRNLALALFLGTQFFPQPEVIMTLLAFGLYMMIGGAGAAMFLRRRAAR